MTPLPAPIDGIIFRYCGDQDFVGMVEMLMSRFATMESIST